MGRFRFQNLFFGLMALAFISTFMLPSRLEGKFRPQLGVLFFPISRPSAFLARSVSGRNQVVAASTNDHRSDDTLRQENEVLRGEVARLRAVLDESSLRDKELAELGDISKYCVWAQVAGSDTGGRESITLVGRALLNVKANMFVLTHDGLVGRIDSVSNASAQVRLITDPGVRLRCRIVRYVNGKFELAPLTGIVVEGRGDGLMIIRQQKLSDLRLDSALKPTTPEAGAAVQADDYCMLEDAECPRLLQEKMIGKVQKITTSPAGRLMADVIIQPMVGLKHLSVAMVLNQER